MKLLNFGSLNLDYVYSVEHFVQAGETVASERLEQFAGGKGLNQSVAFARAGAETYHAGLIGAEGEMLRQTLTDSGVDTGNVRTVDGISCGHAIIQVTPAGENCILLFGGANRQITDPFIDEVLSDFGAGDWLMLQNEINGLDSIIQRAHAKGMTVILNPSPCDERITALDLSRIDWLILNETEGCQITGKREPEAILETLLCRYPYMKVVLTLGSRGSVYADRSTRAEQDIFPVRAVDTTAAGDTFTGYFFSSVMAGKTPAEALRIASAASALAVSRKGAAPSIPRMEEVLTFLSTAV
ncbi:MAG: ribokinase [Clostridia bacterium]|nr:ribokinase [Clostridia bacterium]